MDFDNLFSNYYRYTICCLNGSILDKKGRELSKEAKDVFDKIKQEIP